MKKRWLIVLIIMSMVVEALLPYVVYAQDEVSKQKTIKNQTKIENNLEEIKIQDGTYKILMASNLKQSLTVDGGNKNNGANVQLWEYFNTPQQQFDFKYDGNGYYEIIPVHSGKRLDVEGWENGANVAQWPGNGKNDNQKWKIVKSESGNYNIVSKRQNLYLDVYQSKIVNGTNIQVYEKSGGVGQEFKLEKIEKTEEKPQKIIEEGTYKIVTASNPKQSLTVDGGNKNNGVNVQLWEYLDTSQQQFNLKYDGKGYYEIIPVHSGKRIDVAGWGNGANVDQWSENGGSDNQKWKIVKSASGNYNIVSKRQNLYLDIYQSKIVNGTNVQVYEKSGGKGQEFKLEKIEQHEEKPKKTVEEGTYKIVMASNLKQSLTVDGGNKNNGVNVQLWEYFNTPQQQFDFKYDGNGYYEIIPVHSGKRLDVAGWKNGANVEQWPENGGNDNQKWKIVKSESGNYNIVSKRQNLYLDVYQSKIVNGTNVQVYEKSGGKGQEFRLEKIEQHEERPQKTVEEGTYKIVMASNSKQSLTVDGGNTNNGANVQLWEYVNAPQQQFNLKYTGNGYYEIIPVHSGKRIDMTGWGNKTNVSQWSSSGEKDNQKWKIVKNESGNYNIISERQNLYLDVYQSKLINGTNIQVYEKSGGIGQEFKLEKINNKSEKTILEGCYKIAPQVNKNLVIEAANSNNDNNGKIQIWKDYNVRTQKFKIEYENGYYKIAMVHSGKYLTVKDRKISSGTDVIQYEWNNGENQKWIIRDNGDGSLGIIPLSNSGLTLDVRGPIENGSSIEIYNNEQNMKQRFCFIKSNIGVNIDTTKYPGISEMVDKIAIQHPNWEFEILYTTLDFNKAVQGEYEYANRTGNLVYIPTYTGDWIAPNPYKSGSWASASYKGIAYFMDPRNFLNDVDVFQFVDLGNYVNSGATLNSIQQQVTGTFLNNYAETIRMLCEKNNINPYYVIARLFQEQGIQGSATINMDGGDGKRYFNPFNIGAVVGNDVQTALERAKREGWDTMEKGIEGGIRVLRKGYIDVHQNTLYLNKFDVNPASGSNFYSHQYMQNLSAAYSEARIFRQAYEETNTLDNNIKFIIPVYENMPENPSERPTGQGKIIFDKGPMNVQVLDTDMGLALREGPNASATLIERLKTGTILLSVERLSNGWHKVITDSGKIGYCSNSNLKIIDDVVNCNEWVYVDTKDNIGTNVRIGPGTDFEIIRAVAENSKRKKDT